MSAEPPDVELDDAERALVQRLRALPPEGDEPDWSAMARAIRDAVGDDVPRPWWRRWAAILPATTFVTAMAVLLLVMWGRGTQVVEPTLAVPAARDVPATQEAAHEDVAANVVTLWLDGAEVEVDAEAPAARALVEAADDDTDDDGLGSGLAWVDHLDDAALDRAERWLDARQEIPARKKG